MSQLDANYTAIYGWSDTVSTNINYKLLWTPQRLQQIQRTITQLLRGVREDGRDIIIPIETIGSVLRQVFNAYTPHIGDIHSRFVVSGEYSRDDIRDIVDRCIEIIVTQTKNEIITRQQNSKLSIWNSVLGEANDLGLRAHPPLKLNNRRPATFMFNMNY